MSGRIQNATVTAALAIAVVTLFHVPSDLQAQSHPASTVVECIVLGEYGPELGLCVVPEYYGAQSSDAMDHWRWQQAVNDRAHQAFIDGIWDRDPQSRRHHEQAGWEYNSGYYSPYGGYSPAGGYGTPHGAYDYWDPMASWYRNQAANDRAHDAFIDYIRN